MKSYGHKQVLLGEGSFGKVYRIYDQSIERTIILKVLKRTKSTDLLLEEAKVQSSIKSKQIPEIYGVTETRKNICIEMEWVKGLSLAYFNQQVLLEPEEYIQLLYGTLTGMTELHQKGIVHGDISPENFICDINGVVFVTDFGFSHSTDKKSFSNGGTPEYAAPELLHGGEPPSLRSDVYALGAIWVKLLFNFSVKKAIRLDEQINLKPQKKDDFITNPLYQKVWPLLMGCLTEDPSKRWGSVMELKSQFDQVLGETGEDWQEKIKLVYAPFLASKLTDAARDYLLEYKQEDAYSLLMEALKWDMDHSSALKLLSESDFSKKKGHSKYLYIGSALLLFGLLVVLLLPPKRSIKLTLPTNVNQNRMESVREEMKALKVKAKVNLKLAKKGGLVGTIQFVGFSQESKVYINNVAYLDVSHPLKLNAGELELRIQERDSIVFRKKITLRPFQKLALNYNNMIE